MNRSERDQAIEVIAANWDARLRSPDCSEADRLAFKEWLADDPAHAEMFERLQQTLELMRLIGERPQLRAMRENAVTTYRRGAIWKYVVGAGIAAGLIALVGSASLDYMNGHRRPTVARTGMPRSASVVAAVASAASSQGTAPAPRDDLYVTAANERREVGLNDGSIVALNADTRLLTHFTRGRRDVRLLSGEALFRVMKDSTRPFVVRAGDREVIAVGTAFEVRLIKRSLNVTLLEGKVTVKPVLAGVAGEVHLVPNQQMAMVAGGLQQVRWVDTAKVTGWTEGKVYFDDTPLDEAVEEMNRYSVIKIELSDPALSRYRLSGVFRTGSQLSFVEAVETYFPVRSARADQARIVLDQRP